MTSSTLLIAAASNVQFVLKELIEVYEKTEGIDCDVVVSSSGKLASQISAGASYDVMISADQYYPAVLDSGGHTMGHPITYVSGKLILWSTQHTLQGEVDLLATKYETIAIANPDIAPYGKAAIGVLKSMNIEEMIKDRLVFGENISQVNQFVSVGAADIGITSQSVVLAPDLQRKGSWVMIPDTLYSPILQDVVALKNGKATEKQKLNFIEFLLSEKAQDILKKYGYLKAT